MSKNINSAYRIKEILVSINKNQDKTPMHEVWAAALGIKDKDHNKKIFSISRGLADLHDEVELVRTAMEKLGYSQHLYNANLDKCNAIFAVHLVANSWGQIKHQLTTDITLCLGFCSEILPNEEDLVSQESLEELKLMSEELRRRLVESTLSDYMKQIIEKHLNKIDEALSKYKIQGAKILEDALKSAYGEVIANEALFKESKGREEIGKLSNIWQKTKSVIDGVVDTNKRLGAVEGMAEKGRKVIELLQDLNL